MKTLIFAFSLLTVLPIAARPFKSADGRKTIEAELISYSPSSNTVVLQIAGQTTRTTTKADAFSKEDQEYFNEFLRESEKFAALEVTSKEESEKFESTKGIYIYEKRKEHFNVSVENRSEFSFGELTASYDIYVSKYDKEGKKFVEVVSGKESIESINSKGQIEFQTGPVETNIDCSTTSSCPKCKKHASSVERERIIGMRVSISNSDDEVLASYYSSNSTRSTAEKMDSEN